MGISHGVYGRAICSAEGVGISLGNAGLDLCPNLDDDDDGVATVDELVRAVNRALNGCFG